jgi:hypothetical protein
MPKHTVLQVEDSPDSPRLCRRIAALGCPRKTAVQGEF